jgi:hypothetical protein
VFFDEKFGTDPIGDSLSKFGKDLVKGFGMKDVPIWIEPIVGFFTNVKESRENIQESQEILSVLANGDYCQRFNMYSVDANITGFDREQTSSSIFSGMNTNMIIDNLNEYIYGKQGFSMNDFNRQYGYDGHMLSFPLTMDDILNRADLVQLLIGVKTDDGGVLQLLEAEKAAIFNPNTF